MRAWIFAMVLSVTVHVHAQAPVEERRPAGEDAGSAQRRVEFARQALDRAQAQVRDATAEQEEAQLRFEQTRTRLDETQQRLVKARATATDARKRYEAESTALDRQRAGKGGSP